MTDASTLTLKLSGSRTGETELPALLRGGPVRGATASADPFLPDDYLRVVEAYDLTPAGRSAAAAVSDVDVRVEPGQVLVLELPDGTTLVTSGARLEEELRRVAPESVQDRSIALDTVQPRGAVSRGIFDSLGRLVGRVFVLDRGGVGDAILDEAIEKVRESAGDALADKLRQGAGWGVSALATRALMWAIERRLPRGPGLYRWSGAQVEPAEAHSVDDRRLVEAAAQGPLLVFIHGTASSTSGSFGDLRAAAPGAQLDWDRIASQYGERVYALEHRTFSESPIENALLLARTLPARARIDLVTHSRGGIVGDLLAADWSDAARTQALIDGYRRFRTPENAGASDLDQADDRDRRDLQALAAEIRGKRITVGRYVRVAAPVNGTLLAGSNLDLFLSGLLTLVGAVTTLAASPYYLALKRIVLEIARNRADANRVPGLESMLPGSAVSRLLRLAAPQQTLRLGVIAGDIEGASRFKRLVEFLADWALFERQDNDLVVDTASMAAGLARPDNARRLFVQGPRVDHFSYFGNDDSRAALAGWLTAADPGAVAGFEQLARGFAEPRGAIAIGAARGGGPQPVVIVLPGIMGSHLQRNGDRVWFDPLAIAMGGLKKIAWTPESLAKVSAEKLFELFYADLCRHLAQSHRVVPYPYDWRRPVQHAAQGLAKVLREALAETRAAGLPVRILAHSMGGLVTRAMAAAEPALWDEFLGRDGARFVMLGTPNQGSHLMVEMLIGKGDTLRKLTMLQGGDLQDTLDLVAGFRGALQLLPRPGFRDGGTPIDDYLREPVWRDLKPKVFDFWFGNFRVAVPPQAVCDEARALWHLPEFRSPRVPGGHPDKVIYICGKAENTPCGITLAGDRVKMIGTPEGDGSVSWASGRIDGIGEAYLMDAAHGDLAAASEHFDALMQLLADGATDRLPRGWPSAAVRGEAPPAAVIYDAGPATVPTDEEAARSLLGATERRPRPRRAAPAVLRTSVTAMDLRYAADPILVGHYERDPISGAEAIIDRDVVGNELTMRRHLGLYPGAVGTATIVLLDQNALERSRGTQRGALVTGMGEWGELTSASLAEAVRAAALRYLLAKVEREGGTGASIDDRTPALELGLCSLLLGFSSTANIGVADSVYAIVRGVLEANRQFASGQQRRKAAIVRLEIVERSIDVAITAARELHAVAARLARDARDLGMRVEAAAELAQGEGARPRLEVQGTAGYWPRLIVTDASAPRDADAASAAGARAAAPEKLKYVFLAQRARAEAEVVQSQPGLIDTLVRLSMHSPAWNRDLSRTLFQLMVPLGFKESARQTDALALLVDEKTANLPWELLASGDEPMAIRTAMVRQLASGRWRQHVRSSIDRAAYVVGNPSTRGFAAAFFGDGGPAGKGKAARRVDPPPLPGAEAEAYAVGRILRAAGYQLTESIGVEQQAIDVLNRLFQRPYRIVHIAAHGEFALEAGDGKARTGVLLSDGLMLTAAEVGQMEVVPDLVFLNCCHLGTIDGQPSSGEVEVNRLAASLARELIEMGVRAVVVAGWAVDDRASQHFAEVFYRRLIDDGRPFGAAAFEARRATWEAFRSTNTWGAFQAYGDPGFLIDPSRPGGGGGGSSERFVAPQELVDQLEQLREWLKRSGVAGPATTLAALRRQVEALLERGPKRWRERGDVNDAIARVYAGIGEPGFAAARAHYLQAIEDEDDASRVPIKAIEQLANLEVRGGAGGGEAIDEMRRGADRIRRLVAVVSKQPSEDVQPTPERCGLIGSAFKRLAANLARQGAAGDDARALRAALDEAREWYRRGEGEPGTPREDLYCLLNRLAIDALLGRGEAAAMARQAGDAARAAFRDRRDYWHAMMPADALLTAAMADGTLDDPVRAASAIERVVDGYRQASEAVRGEVRQWDSVIRQIGLLALLARAIGRSALAASLDRISGQFHGEDETAAGTEGAGAAPPGSRTRPRVRRTARGAVTAARSGAASEPFSRHFTLAEMTRSPTAERLGIDNHPGAAGIDNLRALCAGVLDPLREAVGRPIKINSGYRGPALNARIGGASSSQHLTGQAADIQSPGMPVVELFKTVIRCGLPYDQLIYEARGAGARWVHVSHSVAGNRGEIRVAEFDAAGRPLRYPLVSRRQALAMTEPTTRSATAAEPGYVEVGDEPDEAAVDTPRPRTQRRSAASGKAVAPAARSSPKAAQAGKAGARKTAPRKSRRRPDGGR
jgi:CHAT domain-containing protein